MKRTSRDTLKEDNENDSGDEDIKKEDKKRLKKFKKDDSLNYIKTEDIDIAKEKKSTQRSISRDIKSGTSDKQKALTEFLDLVNKIEKNISKFEMKPIYCEKPICETNPNILKLLSITKFKLISPIEIYYKIKYEQFHKLSLEGDRCSICLFDFYDDDLKDNNIGAIKKFNESKKNDYDAILLKNCSDHFFHLDCLMNLIGDKASIKCPICNKIYGTLTGNQPKGTMRVESHDSFSCSGYEDSGTIIITYNFPSGKGYSGTARTAYLPDNKEGREILALLKIAFDRKLSFTIGTSVTTGQENTTIWNGIHHKTNTTGGAQYFGFPDPTYFNRIKQELAAKGVLEENIDGDLQEIADNLLARVDKIKNRSNSRGRTRR